VLSLCVFCDGVRSLYLGVGTHETRLEKMRLKSETERVEQSIPRYLAYLGTRRLTRPFGCVRLSLLWGRVPGTPETMGVWGRGAQRVRVEIMGSQKCVASQENLSQFLL
jgi:hypothetical protein